MEVGVKKLESLTWTIRW